MNFCKKICLYVLCTFLFVFLPDLHASDTMLMFVGEDLEVLSIASRKEEAAWKAPAVADVVLRKDFEKTGDETIAEVLDTAAGFDISHTEKGSVPFLRGVPDSALILYDTVPLGSGVNKTFHYIDHETSLASIKRIEIIRGAGSVLWGPDAFAGVVNAVPMTGKDLNGFETGVSFSLNGLSGHSDNISSGSSGDSGFAYVNHGADHGSWNSFLSFSGGKVKEDAATCNVVNFWKGQDKGDAVFVEDRYGEKKPGDSHYVEFYSSFAFQDWLTLSARLSDNTKAFSVSDWSGDYIWEEKISAPTQTFKIEISKDTGLNSGIRFTGYYTKTDLTHEIIDREFDQTEESFYGELIHDRSFFTSKGLLTTGISWRNTEFKDIPVWNGFMPDYFTMDNPKLLPSVEEKDYENSLFSFFGQYRHGFKDIELWAGARTDFHDKFQDKTSFSWGASYNISPTMIIKTIYGTAYRTPFAKQMEVQENLKLEKIENMNFQIAFKPGKEKKISLTLFRNGIDNHVIEDSYAGAGLSKPNSQIIYGAELECDYRFSRSLSVSSDFTLLTNSGADETWLYLHHKEYDEPIYYNLQYDYNAGADTMFNFALSWDFTENITITPQLKYFSKRVLYSPKEDITKQCDAAWLLDLNLQIRDVFPFDIDFYMENIADTDFYEPGSYSIIKGRPFTAGVKLKMRW